MLASQMGLPLELQQLILETLYGEWHLCAYELESSDGNRLITFKPSSSYPVSPLLVSRQWHQYAIGLLTRNFRNFLDMTTTSLRCTTTGDNSRDSHTKELSQPFKLTHEFGHLYDRITTLQVDSCSMLVAGLSVLQQHLSKLENVEVVPTFRFCVYEGQLSCSEITDTSQEHPWTEAWESWFTTWIGFTWLCSRRALSSLRSCRYNIFYKQTFVFEDFNSEKLVSDVH